MSGVTQEDLHAWCVERFGEVLEDGGLSLIGAVRYSASGGEVPLMSLTSKMDAAKWNADNVAATLGTICDRDARGLPGVTQFQLIACFGANPKPCRFLPFQRAGQLNAGPLPNGGLGMEGPHPTGIMSTAQRWGEEAIKAAAAKDQLIIGTFGALLKDERAHNIEVMKENREVIGLLRQFIADAMGQSVALRKLDRDTRLIFEGIKVAPALLNGISGKTLIPGEEASAAEILFDSMSKEELGAYLRKLESTSPMKAAAMASMMANIKKKREAEARELREMGVSGGKEPTMADAEAELGFDLIDRGVAAVRGTNGKATDGASNGADAGAKESALKADITLRRLHGRTKEEARAIAEILFTSLKESFGGDMEEDRDGDVLGVQATSGVAAGAQAVLRVTDTELQVAVVLPKALRLFKGKIEARLVAELDERLHATTTNGEAHAQ